MASRSTLLLLAALAGAAFPVAAPAATIAPPMLDIPRGCNALAHKNMRLMSECIVAESEARADLLQHWQKLPDASVERCLKLNAKDAKAKKQPYVAMENCLAPDLSAAAAAPQPERK
jgi:hypothetical protein